MGEDSLFHFLAENLSAADLSVFLFELTGRSNEFDTKDCPKRMGV